MCEFAATMKPGPGSAWSSRRWLVAACGLTAWFGAVAGGAPSDDHLNFQRFSPRDGLPAAVVYCGMEDSRGFLWFGTADGVARFDGHQFRVFRPDPADPDSLANGAVLGIQEDAKGNLWMATEGGLDLWLRGTERFVHFKHDPANPASLGDNTTQSILLDDDGTLWIGTRNGGLDHFDPATGKFGHFPTDPRGITGLTDAWIRCLYRDRHGVLSLGTGNGGLDRLDRVTRQFRVYRNVRDDPRSLSDNRVSAIVEDRAGDLWVGTDGGLCRLDAQRGDFERYPIGPNRSDALPSRTVPAS